MIENLHRLNTLAGQCFDEKMVTQVEAESKQLKVLAEKTKVMSEYAQALIDEADEHTRKASKRIKANAIEREEQDQAQETILKVISKMLGPQRLELTSNKLMRSGDNYQLNVLSFRQ